MVVTKTSNLLYLPYNIVSTISRRTIKYYNSFLKRHI